MLYDPKWEVQTKPDVFSLEGLIAWLETMPPDGTYEWRCNNGRCLIAKYGEAMGVNWRDVHSHFFDRDELHVASAAPHTFGAALNRARAAL